MNRREIIEGTDVPSENAHGISWINILLGIWVIISPFALGFGYVPRAMWNNVILGIVIAIVAIIRTSTSRQSAWSWVNVLLGIWVIISPLALGFVLGNAIWNNFILGIIMTILAWSSAVRAQPVTA
jgi:hypothetical protein